MSPDADRFSVSQVALELSRAADAREPDFDNLTAASYLEALSAWLVDGSNSYANTGRQMPPNPWQFIEDALRAAANYE